MTDDSVGYSDISFSRASPVWKCHCILAVSRLRSISHADNSHLSLSRVDIRRERHWRVITLKLNFCHVKPTSMFRRIVDFQSFYDPSCFLMVERLYKIEAALWVFRLSITSMIFFASGNISSDRYLISIAQSIAVWCSWTLTWCLPPSGSTKANMLQVPFLLYSESVFWLSPGRTGSGCLTSSKAGMAFHPYRQQGTSGHMGSS